jgi:hypothetical protein
VQDDVKISSVHLAVTAKGTFLHPPSHPAVSSRVHRQRERERERPACCCHGATRKIHVGTKNMVC